MNIIAALRTPVATLAVLCMALLAQLPHAADVFRMIVGGEGWLAIAHGYAYAVALELAVLLFVVQRRDAESYLFAGVSVLVNLSYYALHGIDLFSIAALPAWLVSIALPAAIARYSHLLVETPTSAESAAESAAANAADRLQAPEVETANLQPEPLQVAAPTEPQTSAISTAKTAPKPAPKRRNRKPAKLPPEQRRAQIAESGMTDANAVAAQFSIALRTAHADLAAVRNATLSENGVHG
jgi:hypothetical protein